MSCPSRPARLFPSPCRPRSATNCLWYWKAISVFAEGSVTIQTEPPVPPLPPSGPPRGTPFSRRNERQPSPPRPPRTRILASSTKVTVRPVGAKSAPRRRREAGGSGFGFGGRGREHAHDVADAPAIAELDDPRDHGEERVVLAAADVLAGLDRCAALPDQ